MLPIFNNKMQFTINSRFIGDSLFLKIFLRKIFKNNGSHKIFFLIIFLFGLSPVVVNAQTEDETLETEEVEIIRNFDARLKETEKQFLSPELPEPKEEDGPLEYTVPSKLLAIEYPTPKIRPIAMRRDKIPSVYAGYLKAGFGSPNSPYLLAGYHYEKEKELNIGGQVMHHSANFKDVENQRFSFTNGKLYGTYFFEEGFAAEAQLAYTGDVVHFYGYNDQDTSFTQDEVQRQINIIDFGGRFFNTETTFDDINYEAAVNFYSLNESFGDSKETGFVLDAGMTKYFEEKHPLNIKLITDFTQFNDSVKQELNNFFFQPTFSYHGDNFNVKVGANVASSQDNFFFFPDLEVSVSVLGSQLAAFAGWNGDLRKNNMRNLLRYNPFINSVIDVRNTRYQDFYGGLKGNINNIEYQAQAGYKTTKDLALFLNDTIDSRQLNVVYDTANIFYLKGSIIANPVQDLEVIATLGYNVFDLNNEAKAWHLPNLEANVGLIYSTKDDKARLRAELYLANGVPYLDAQQDQQNLNALYDISLGVEYFFAENIGGFLNVNNLANNKRERWFNYPVYGLNANAGVSARF